MAQHQLGETATASQRPSWVVPLGISVVAFFFRIYLGHAHPEFGGDALQYTAIARNLAAGHGYSFAHTAPYLATDIRLPAYPALLAVAFSVSGSHRSVVVLNALLGAVTTFLLWLIADGLHLSRTRALWCTGIAAFWLATASFTGTVYSENLSVPAILAFVYFVLIRPPGPACASSSSDRPWPGWPP
jgi:hypothetical protein